MNRQHRTFGSVRTEGGLLPQDLLSRIHMGDTSLAGTKAGTYNLVAVRIGEAVEQAWHRMRATWLAFQAALDRLPEGTRTTSVTRDKWLLPLFQELGYGRLPKGTAITVVERTFAITHSWHRSPIHLLGTETDLDRRQRGVAGAAASSPHGLVQDFLNSSDDHLWGFLSNGYQLRILRDHHSLTRQAYVEFDLQAIMDGEQYSEFLLLWLLCHQSRVEADKPHECWLEQWAQASRDEGVRALDKLRDGVEQAIVALGTGFLAHKANTQLQEDLRSGELDGQEYYHQLLRLVYRMIFLFVAEERDALLDPQASEDALERYRRFYATRRLRELSDKRRGGPHGDLWRGLALVMSKLNDGCSELALPALGSRLWGPTACPWLMEAECANEHLLNAVRRLSHIQEGKTRYPVNWRNNGADELGSIYESLLELHPRINREAATFELDTAAGHERKTTGSYYTPTSLVDCLLDSALDPVLEEAARKREAEAAILDLKVCDPACGSGHFLVAAARRIARRLAMVRSGADEPSPRDVRHALRDVVGRCIYGVDINPMAVELCKVSLWMEALEPGKPLSFLDSHIVSGNALLGATPALMSRGIPDDAFKPIEGDDKDVAKRLKARNRQERKTGQTSLFGVMGGGASSDLATVAAEVRSIEQEPDGNIEAVRSKQRRWEGFQRTAEYKDEWLRADAWCAAFVWPKQPGAMEHAAVTHDLWRRLASDVTVVPMNTKKTVHTLAQQYRFLHWHLAFPHVFRGSKSSFDDQDTTGWIGGFDVVIGNPPYVNIDDTWGNSDPRLSMIRGFFPHIYNDKTDLVFYFLAKSVAVAVGRAALLVSRSFLEAYKANRLRDWLGRNCRVAEIVDFQNHMVFPGVGVAVAIASFERTENAPATYRRARRDADTSSDLPDRRSDDNFFEVFSVDQDRFTGAPWAFVPPTLSAIVDDLDGRGERVSSFLKLGQGMQTGRNGAFSIEQCEIDAWQLDKHLWKTRLRNSDIRRYSLRDSGKRLLYVEDVPKFNDLPTMAQEKLLAEKKALKGRAAFKRGNCEWWRYTWPLNKSLHDSGVPRIWCPYMATDNHFALDTEGRAIGLTDTTVIFDSGQTEDIRFILAVLNSRPMTFRYSFIGKLKGSVREYFWNGIGDLRIPRIDPSDAGQRSAHDRIVELVKRRIGSQDDLDSLQIEAEIDALLALQVWGLEKRSLELILDALPAVRENEMKNYGDYRTKTLILDTFDRIAQAIDNGEYLRTSKEPTPAHPSLTHPESTRPDWAKKG